jgi:iron complex outermembrane recepter protein
VIDKLFPVYGYTGKTTQTFVEGKLSGSIGQWMAGPVGVAAGVDLRREKFAVLPTQRLRDGDIVGVGVASSDASRTFGAVYSELSLLPLKNLEVQVAARVDKFPGFGAHVSPKLGLSFRPVAELLLRGTAEGGFRAPNLTESAPSTKFAFSTGIADPKRCPAASTLADDLRALADALPDSDPNQSLLLARADNVQQSECSAGVASIVSNNPDLKPETSKSFSLGVVFEPMRGLSASIDAWSIERKKEIGIKNVEDLLAQEDSLAPGVLLRDSLANDSSFTAEERAKYGVAAGRLLAANGRFDNLLRTKTSGVDLSVKGNFDAGFARLGYDMDAVYLISLRNFSPELNRYGDNLAGRYDYPRWSVGQTFTLSHGDLTHSLRYTWRDATTLNTDYFDSTWTVEGCARVKVTPEECRYGSYQRLDYGLSYTGIKNLVLSLNVRNLANRRPPVDWREFGGSSGIVPVSLEDVQGRMYRVSLQYKFL